eukprot:4555601-Pyramimonas_sp.AAC.1
MCSELIHVKQTVVLGCTLATLMLQLLLLGPLDKVQASCAPLGGIVCQRLRFWPPAFRWRRGDVLCEAAPLLASELARVDMRLTVGKNKSP